MRDIRDELLTRFAAAQNRRVEAQQNYERERSELEERYRSLISEIERERNALEVLIRVEERRLGGEPLLPQPAQLRLPLAEFFLTVLRAEGPQTREQLTARAEEAGYFVGIAGGRATNTTLFNIAKSGKVVKRADGFYSIPTTEDLDSIFSMLTTGKAEEEEQDDEEYDPDLARDLALERKHQDIFG